MPLLDKTLQKSILTPSVLRIMQALDGQARAVGGCVRDVLLGCEAGDIDLATPFPPEKVTEKLEEKGIKVVPTGITHGTVTAVLDRVGYEITTLRRDVETDGRHARVEFTDDWQADAARRDFTMNALYVDADAALYDYFNGGKDAREGRVRFIGDAKQRILEDVLRILRFFRFYACLGRGEADPEALAACRELAPLIPRLSIERVARELLKLLAAANPAPALLLMKENGVSAYVLPEMGDFSRLEGLRAAEKKHHVLPLSLTRLAALLPQDRKAAIAAALRLKLSNKDIEMLEALAELPALLSRDAGPERLRSLMYDYGQEQVRAGLLLTGKEIAEALKTVDAWENPIFPLTGKDLLGVGIPPGPVMGSLLKLTEKWWREGDFRAGRAACLDQAKAMGKNP